MPFYSLWARITPLGNDVNLFFFFWGGENYYCIKYVIERRRYCPTRRGNCFKLYYKYPSWYTCTLRKLYIGYILCLDTCLYHVIHQSHVILLMFVVSRWETAKSCPKTDLRNLWIVSSFVLFFFTSDIHRFLPILSRSDVRPPRVLHIVFMFIKRYHVIFNHVTVFSVSFVKGIVEFVTLSENFDYLYHN